MSRLLTDDVMERLGIYLVNMAALEAQDAKSFIAGVEQGRWDGAREVVEWLYKVCPAQDVHDGHALHLLRCFLGLEDDAKGV